LKHLAVLAAIAGLACSAALAQEPPTFGFEFKRQNTSRGTPEETTQNLLRLERYFDGAPVRLLRLDLPFPDKKTDFAGNPLEPGLGDVKIRAGFQPLRSGELSFPSFVEFTFPSADPKGLGAGKYQASAGLRVLTPMAPLFGDPSSHTLRFEAEIQQVSSYAGDPGRKRISYTKLEATLYGVWDDRYTLKAKLKPSIDWVQNGKAAAVAEIEGGLLMREGWRAWLMLGHLFAGPEGVPPNYDKRLELGLARRF